MKRAPIAAACWSFLAGMFALAPTGSALASKASVVAASACVQSLGSYRTQVRNCSVAIAADPRDWVSYAGRSRAYLALGEVEKGEADAAMSERLKGAKAANAGHLPVQAQAVPEIERGAPETVDSAAGDDRRGQAIAEASPEAKGRISTGEAIPAQAQVRGRTIDGAGAVAAGADIPQIDVALSCQVTGSATGVDESGMPRFVERCLGDEQRSYDEVKAIWGSLDRGVKAGCGQALRMIDLADKLGKRDYPFKEAGYTVLLTCVRAGQSSADVQKRVEDVGKAHPFKF